MIQEEFPHKSSDQTSTSHSCICRADPASLAECHPKMTKICNVKQRLPRQLMPLLLFAPIFLVTQLLAYNLGQDMAMPLTSTMKRTIYPTRDGPYGNGTDCEYLWYLGYHENGTDNYNGKWYYKQHNETYTDCTNDTGFSIFLDACRPHIRPDGTFGVDWEHTGGLAVWFFVVWEMLIGIATIMPIWENILQIIADRLHMSDDIAGATLMSAGTSSTTCYIVLMGIGNKQSTLGGGTIIGSCLWNTLVIVGASLVVGPGGCNNFLLLDYRAIWRDTIFGFITYTWLCIIFIDAEITWYECLIGIALYAVYLVFLWQQWNVYTLVSSLSRPWTDKYLCCCLPSEQIVTRSIHHTEDHQIEKEDKKEAAVRTSLEMQRTPMPEGASSSMNDGTLQPDIIPNENKPAAVVVDKWEKLRRFFKCRRCRVNKKGRKLAWWYPIWAFWEYPWRIMYLLTIPKPTLLNKKCKFAPHFTFLTCICWLILNTYLIVLATIQIGCLFNMTEDLLGVTILAMLSACPDCFSSIAVARKGMGSFAVANGLASNVFNNCIALGVPFLLSTIIFQKPVEVENESLYTYIAWAYLMLVALNIGFSLVRFKAPKLLGVVFLVLYAMFIAFCVAYNKLAYPWANPHP